MVLLAAAFGNSPLFSEAPMKVELEWLKLTVRDAEISSSAGSWLAQKIYPTMLLPYIDTLNTQRGGCA